MSTTSPPLRSAAAIPQASTDVADICLAANAAVFCVADIADGLP